jgi:hypothetical protein
MPTCAGSYPFSEGEGTLHPLPPLINRPSISSAHHPLLYFGFRISEFGFVKEPSACDFTLLQAPLSRAKSQGSATPPRRYAPLSGFYNMKNPLVKDFSMAYEKPPTYAYDFTTT